MSRKVGVNSNGEMFDPADVNPEEFKASEKAFDADDDKVNHPSHYMSYYKDGIECIDAMKAAFGEVAVAHFCACNAFKYLWRHSSKGQMEDIEKAIFYLNYYKKINRIDMGD